MTDQPPAKPFDPYYTWLGIPPHEPRPLDFYQLLGLRRFESDLHLISAAADKQMGYVQTFKAGPHATLSQQILNELSQARLTLLNEAKRQAYEAALRARLEAQPVQLPAAPASAVRIATAVPVATLGAVPGRPPASGAGNTSSLSHASLRPPVATAAGKPTLAPLVWLGVAGGVAAVLLIAGIVLFSGGTKPGTVALTAPGTARPDAVTIDDKPIRQAADGSVQFTVAPGKHRVRLKRAEYQDFEQELEVKPGARVEIVPNWIAVPTTPALSVSPAVPLPVAGTEPTVPAVAALAPVASATSEATAPPEMTAPALVATPLVSNASEPAGTSLVAPASGSPLPAATQVTVPEIPVAKQRRAVPDQAAQAEVQKLVQDVLGEELKQANTPAAHVAMAKQLLTLAEQEQESTPRYVMWSQAQQQALEGQNYSLALEVAARIANEFAIEKWELSQQLLEQAEAEAKTAGPRKQLLTAARQAAEQAAAEEAYDAALAILTIAETTATKSRLTSERKEIQLQQQALTQERELFAAVPPARVVLTNNPTDAAANTTLGHWFCEVKLDFSAGLPHLALGSDIAWKKLAELEQSRPTTDAEMVALADQWWELAQTKDLAPASKRAAMIRAGHWYGPIVARASGLVRLKAEARLKEIDPFLPGEAPAVATQVPAEPARPKPATTSAQPALAGNSTINLNGILNQTTLPLKMPSAWKRPGVFAEISGEGMLESARLPEPCFVFEMDLTVHTADSQLEIIQGDSECKHVITIGGEVKDRPAGPGTPLLVSMTFFSNSNKRKPSLIPLGQPVRLRFIIQNNLYALDINEQRQFRNDESEAHDLRLQINTARNCKVTIARCEYLPLTPEDSRSINAPHPTTAQRNPAAAQQRFEDGWKDLKDRPTQGQSFLVNTTQTPMQWIEPGVVQLGQRVETHNVKVQPVQLTRGYWIGRFEFTQGEWEKLNENNPSRSKGSPYLPVHWISRAEALDFCQRLNQVEGRARRLPAGYEYRLPTEAEWEYAAKANPDGRPPEMRKIAWLRDNSGYVVHEVGELEPNAWGLYDVSGNVAEMCLDRYAELESTPVADRYVSGRPTDEFVIRGGCFYYPGQICQAGYRGHRIRPLTGVAYYGFRLALAPKLLSQ